jgi:tRNA pseudouridine38-40 synthase
LFTSSARNACGTATISTHTAYAGWQVQPDRETVQGALEVAIARVAGCRVRVIGAGRTDAGVHRSGRSRRSMFRRHRLYRLRASLNGLTGHDISVVTLAEAPAGFDPRRSARSRTYRYTIISGRPPAPMLRDRSWHVYPTLDPALLVRLAERIVGVHDFSAFRAGDCESETTEREVIVSTWATDDGVYTYEVTANAFLKQMVRVLVGTMVEVALGRMKEEEFERLLRGGARTAAGPTAPARPALVRVDHDRLVMASEFRQSCGRQLVRPSCSPVR